MLCPYYQRIQDSISFLCNSLFITQIEMLYSLPCVWVVWNYALVGGWFLTLSILWRSPLYGLPPPFSNFAKCLFPKPIQPPPPLFFLLFYFFGRMGDRATFDVPLNIMHLHMSNLITLIPEGPSCDLYKASSLLRSDTCGFLLVLWFDIRHIHTQTHNQKDTHKDTHHMQGSTDWHTYMN